jgi:hypothetical protein
LTCSATAACASCSTRRSAPSRPASRSSSTTATASSAAPSSRGRSRTRSALAALLLAALVACGPAEGRAEARTATPTPAPAASRIRIEAPPTLDAERRDVEAAFARALPGLEAFFGGPLARAYTVELVATRAAFVAATGGRVPAWAVGVALSDEARVVVTSAHAGGPRASTGSVAVHEIVHLFVGEVGGDDVPRWLNEGVAVYLSGEDRGASFFDLARALVTEDALYLSEIEDRFPVDEARVRLAYYESLTAVQFIERRWGAAAIPELLRAIRAGGFDAAIRAVLALSPDDFEDAWERDLRHRTRWVGWTADGAPFALLFALLSVAAIVRKRVLGRRRIAEWEAEERARAQAIVPEGEPSTSAVDPEPGNGRPPAT